MSRPHHSWLRCFGKLLKILPSLSANRKRFSERGEEIFATTVTFPSGVRADSPFGRIRVARYTLEWWPMPMDCGGSRLAQQ